MMPSMLGGNLPGLAPVGHSPNAILDDLSRQIASATSRRLSRGSSGQRVGGAMRVVKPSSANNSPRSSMTQARRRTLMSDSIYAKRNHQVMEQGYLPTPGPDMSSEMYHSPLKPSTRPVSWHPTSHMTSTYMLPQPTTQYPFPPYSELELFPNFQQFPPTPTGYSGYTSPSSAFSPLSLPYSAFEAPQYFSPTNWTPSTGLASNNSLASPSDYPGPHQRFAPSPLQSSHSASDSSAEWNSFAKQGFNGCTAPPTPDGFPAAECGEPKLPAEESIPYQPLEEEEPEGEILIGMGLYDPPEKEVTDPTLQSYRNSVAHLLGSAYKYPEPTGKGLKLEDAWEPPEIEEEEDDDKDADGENQDDE